MRWLQERPIWCPHCDCIFGRRAMDSLCAGKLPAPVPHNGDENTHRLCITTDTIFDLQMNKTDVSWFRWVLDIICLPPGGWAAAKQRIERFCNAPDDEDAELEKLSETDLLRRVEGRWPINDLRRVFVEGAKWWEWKSQGATMWPSDVDEAEAEAENRYPLGRNKERNHD